MPAGKCLSWCCGHYKRSPSWKLTCFPLLRKETEAQCTSDSTALSSWLSEEHLQGRGGMEGMFSQLQGAGLVLSPRSSPHSGRASGTPGDDTSHNPKATQHVRRERGIQAWAWGERAGDVLSGDFLCLFLGVTGLERGLGVLVGPRGWGKGIWGAVGRRAMGQGCWGQGLAGPCLCWGCQTAPAFTGTGTCSPLAGSSVANSCPNLWIITYS